MSQLVINIKPKKINKKQIKRKKIESKKIASKVSVNKPKRIKVKETLNLTNGF